jgi:hypothetical protein
MKGIIEIKVYTTPIFALFLIASCTSNGRSENDGRYVEFGDALMKDEDGILALLLKTVFMRVIERAYPQGIAKPIKDTTAAMLFGKNAMAWSEPGMRRKPVPQPARAIMT